MDMEEILEILENRVHMLLKFQIDKGVFDTSSRNLKDFIKTCVHYKECKGQMPTTKVTSHEDQPEKVKNCKVKCKLDSNYCVQDKVPYQHHIDGS
eukprot:7801607-Ditylum_brightwellii.AAC.1